MTLTETSTVTEARQALINVSNDWQRGDSDEELSRLHSILIQAKREDQYAEAVGASDCHQSIPREGVAYERR